MGSSLALVLANIILTELQEFEKVVIAPLIQKGILNFMGLLEKKLKMKMYTS